MTATIETRLRRLERGNRMLGAGLTAGVILAATGMRGPDEQVITAHRLEMVDEAGRVRALLGIDEDGSAGLFVRDADGHTRAALVHDDAQTALYLMDAEGTVRLGAAQFAHGGGGLALHGADGKGAGVLYLKDHLASLTFYDEQGAVVERTPAPKETE